MSLNEGRRKRIRANGSSGFASLSEEGLEELSFGLVHLLGGVIVTDAQGDGLQLREGDAGFEEGVGVGQ
jgi:hypothetical protein